VGLENVTLLCGGTDGEDGPTDAAGAFADAEITERSQSLGLDAQDYLTRQDAYAFFEAAGGLFKTGLTETNVMDLRVFLID
jgi:glycerate 2-kinase